MVAPAEFPLPVLYHRQERNRKSCPVSQDGQSHATALAYSAQWAIRINRRHHAPRVARLVTSDSPCPDSVSVSSPEISITTRPGT